MVPPIELYIYVVVDKNLDFDTHDAYSKVCILQ